MRSLDPGERYSEPGRRRPQPDSAAAGEHPLPRAPTACALRPHRTAQPSAQPASPRFLGARAPRLQHSQATHQPRLIRCTQPGSPPAGEPQLPRTPTACAMHHLATAQPGPSQQARVSWERGRLACSTPRQHPNPGSSAARNRAPHRRGSASSPEPHPALSEQSTFQPPSPANKEMGRARRSAGPTGSTIALLSIILLAADRSSE